MISILNLYISIYNKLFSTNIFLYILFFNITLILYLFFISVNSFFKLLINFIFLINMVFLLSFLNADFFSAFLLSAELPIILIFIIFYFHKNSLQIDNFYKYNIKKKTYKYFFLFFLFFFIFYFLNNINLFFPFYNFLINDLFFMQHRNDFLIFFYIYYKFNTSFIYLFAIFIFFVSILVILIQQLNKLFSFKNDSKYKNIMILRKQNLLKQSIFKSKLKFYNKKIK